MKLKPFLCSLLLLLTPGWALASRIALVDNLMYIDYSSNGYQTHCGERLVDSRADIDLTTAPRQLGSSYIEDLVIRHFDNNVTLIYFPVGTGFMGGVSVPYTAYTLRGQDCSSVHTYSLFDISLADNHVITTFQRHAPGFNERSRFTIQDSGVLKKRSDIEDYAGFVCIETVNKASRHAVDCNTGNGPVTGVIKAKRRDVYTHFNDASPSGQYLQAGDTFTVVDFDYLSRGKVKIRAGEGDNLITGWIDYPPIWKRK